MQIKFTVPFEDSKETVQILLWWPEEKIMAEKEWTTETVLQVITFIWGYHEYQEIWTADIGNE